MIWTDRANRPTISRIELYARYTGAIWSMLHDMNVNVPPRNKWPANVSLPPSRAGESKPAAKEFTSIDDVIAATKKTNEKETEEVSILARDFPCVAACSSLSRSFHHLIYICL